MAVAYSEFSGICTKFYDLVVDPKGVAKFVYEKVSDGSPKKALFVGSFFLVAQALQERGLELVVTDDSEAMIEEARKRLSNVRFEVRDIRNLCLEEGEFDVAIVIGRVFTHMLTDIDAARALKSVHQVLRPGGVVLLDNYEDSRIQVTNYFNGRVTVRDSDVEIIRDSTTELMLEAPFVVNWSAEYQATSGGTTTTFRDEMRHRAFSRAEMSRLFQDHGFTVRVQGDNFDETSFFTLASRNMGSRRSTRE